MQYSTSSLATTTYSTVQITTTTSQLIHYDSTPYGYNDQGVSFSLSTLYKIQIGGAQLSDPSPCLYYDYFLFNATKGHEIRGHFEAYQRPPYAVIKAPVNFYILSLYQLQDFKHSYCGWYDHWSWEVYASASSYDLDWIVPQNGEYAFLFLAAPPYYGTITLSAKDYSTTVQSSTVTYTSTGAYTLQSTQLIVSTQPNITPPSSTSNYPLALIALIIIIGLLITLITLRKKRQAQQFAPSK